MRFLRLLLVVVYYTPKPKPLPHSSLPHLLLIISVLGFVLRANYLDPHYYTDVFVSPSPLPSVEAVNSAIVRYVLSKHDDAALNFLSRDITTNEHYLVLGATTAPSSVYQHSEQLMHEREKALQLLEIYPTSRDLWLYVGWVSYYLNDEKQIDQAATKLLFIDPNNASVQKFFQQIKDSK